LISARSKKLWPPDTLYGICARAALLEHGGLVVGAVEDGEVASLCHLRGLARRLWMRATARSASCSSLSHSTTRTGSPSPSSLHSFFSNSLGLAADHVVGRAQDGLVER
jgi:hypothetical protein